MPPSAHDVAAELRSRRPQLGKLALHKLLYLAQGHHLATFDRPLFGESIFAWDNGPVVSRLWHVEEHRSPVPDAQPLSEAELNTIGYVLSRYGALSGRDLVHLTHGQEPFKLADVGRTHGTSRRIEQAWMRAYFTDDLDDEESVPLDADELEAWLRDAPVRRDMPGPLDEPSAITARIRELRERAAG